MRYRSLIFLLLFSLAIVSISKSYAQQLFNQEKLEELKNDDDYNYEELTDQTSLWTDFKQWILSMIKKIFGVDNFSGFWEFIINALPYVGLLLFLGVIVWYLAKCNTGSQIMRQHDKSKVTLTEEEELLMKRDLEDLASQAIKNKEHRLAIRYLYLHCLKRLDTKNIVRFTNEKTNFDYVKEIKHADIASAFKSITIVYEQIWYGGLVFDTFYFNQFKSNIDNFHNNLDQFSYAKA